MFLSHSWADSHKNTGVHLGIQHCFLDLLGYGSGMKKTVSFMDAITKPFLLVFLKSQLPLKLDNTKPLLDPKFVDSGCLEVATPVSWVHFVKAFASPQGHCSLTPRPCTLRCTGTAKLENAVTRLEQLPLASQVHTHRIYDWVI